MPKITYAYFGINKFTGKPITKRRHKMSKSILQTERECYITGRTDNLHKHHIFFGANRKWSEKYGCWVYLTAELHNMSSMGVHNGNVELDKELKQDAQREFERRYSHELFMEVFGKNYLD